MRSYILFNQSKTHYSTFKKEGKSCLMGGVFFLFFYLSIQLNFHFITNFITHSVLRDRSIFFYLCYFLVIAFTFSFLLSKKKQNYITDVFFWVMEWTCGALSVFCFLAIFDFFFNTSVASGFMYWVVLIVAINHSIVFLESVLFENKIKIGGIVK